VETSRPMRLILVEDDPPLAHLLLDVMAEAGIEVAPVPSAADALELARSGPWDVCLLGEADPWSRSAPPPEAFAPMAARVPVVVTTVHVWGSESRSPVQAARSYTWCSPPRTGRDRMSPAVAHTISLGVSSPSVR